MATSTFKLYTIEGVDYYTIINKYRELCEQGEKEIDINGEKILSKGAVLCQDYILKRIMKTP